MSFARLHLRPHSLPSQVLVSNTLLGGAKLNAGARSSEDKYQKQASSLTEEARAAVRGLTVARLNSPLR